MAGRELVVLGTAAQAPTRRRNHNGYLLRFDGAGVLFDPGEGTQRQLLLAGVPSTAIDRICITHAHLDHCLGLPGVLARMALDGRRDPVDVYYPAAAAATIEHLARAGGPPLPVRGHPVDDDGEVYTGPGYRLLAYGLDHRVPAVGWRFEEPPGRSFDPALLTAAGVGGPDVGRLERAGSLATGGRTVTLDEVSSVRPGQSFGFVMDTRVCPGALETVRGVDLAVMEATYTAADARLAADYGHLTAGQAAAIAAEGGVRRLVLTHLSQRYPAPAPLLAQAREVLDDVLLVEDLDVVPLPPRVRPARR